MSISTMIARAGTTLTHQRQDADVTRPSGGRKAGAWPTLHSDIACWVQPASASTLARAAAQQMVVTHAIYVEEDLEALANDRVLVGTVYYIVHGFTNQAGLARLWRIDAEELR